MLLFSRRANVVLVIPLRNMWLLDPLSTFVFQTHHMFCWRLLDHYLQVCIRRHFDLYSQTTHTFHFFYFSHFYKHLRLCLLVFLVAHPWFLWLVGGLETASVARQRFVTRSPSIALMVLVGELLRVWLEE